MADINQGMRVGGYIVLIDQDGLRHAIRLGSVLAMSDRDECMTETILLLPGGRSVTIPASFDEVITWLS